MADVVLDVEFVERLIGVIGATRSALENAEAALRAALIEQRPPLRLVPPLQEPEGLRLLEPQRSEGTSVS